MIIAIISSTINCIEAWKLPMSNEQVKIAAMQKARLTKKNPPKLFSDNGSYYIAKDLERYLDKEQISRRFM